MAIGSDFSVAANGDIRHTGGTGTYTVLELYRWLGDLSDDSAATPDDLLDIVSPTYGERKTDKYIILNSPYNISDAELPYLYGGSIEQDGGDTIYDGLVNYGTPGIHIEIMQNGALLATNFWTTGINAVPASGISHQFMVKTRASGADIDGRRLIGMAREFGYTYSEFKINGTERGQNTLALTHELDGNNTTAAATVETWTTLTNVEGYAGLDVDGNGTDEYYYSTWTKAAMDINDLYERTKWLTRRGTASTLYGLDGDLFRGITHQVAISGGSGTWVEPESLSWGTGATAGTGQLLAVDNTTSSSATVMYIQLLTGVAPDANTITGNGGATATAGTVTERTVGVPFFASSTGSAIRGKYGVGVDPGDLTASDSLIDLSNTAITPPNNVQFTVSNLVSGDDRILVGPESSGELEVDQLTLDGAHSSGTTITVLEDIPTDTPTTGTIRVLDTSGVYQRMEYSAYTGKVFTVPTITTTHADLANVFVSYIDKAADATSASFTSVFLANRALFVRVRAGSGTTLIKTFETPSTLTSTGGSVSVIRTLDS